VVDHIRDEFGGDQLGVLAHPVIDPDDAH